MNIKVNRRFNAVDVNNIEKINVTDCCVFVILKTGFPKKLKADCDKSRLLVRMVNAGVKSDRIQELRDK